MTAMTLASVTAIGDMVAPVVLITTGVLMANGLLSIYASGSNPRAPKSYLKSTSSYGGAASQQAG
jgi:hypothetical protein